MYRRWASPRLPVAGLLVVAALLTGPARAQADVAWSAPRLVSATPTAQGSGTAPVLSGDGRFVAYRSSAATLIPPSVPAEQRPPAGSTFGLVVDLTSGRSDLVAPAPVNHLSLSADGRRVAFDTTAPLDPVNDTDALNDVYVRDLDRTLGDAGAYTLVSALDESPRAVAKTAAGAQAPPAGSLSGDGRRVLFVVTGASDLAGPGTPPGQLALRDLDTRRTTVLTTRHDTGAPVADAAVVEPIGGAAGVPGAQLSADGGTVLFWAIEPSLGALTPALPGDGLARTTDLFVRRVPRGRAPEPASRVLGAADRLDPACDGRPVTAPFDPPYPAPGACESPLVMHADEAADGGATAGLSGDGGTAVFRSQLYKFRQAQLPGPSPAFGLADTRPGVTRKAALRELGRAGDARGGISGINVQGLTLSSDGRWLALLGAGGAIAPPGPLSADPDPAALGCGRSPCLHAVDLATNTSRVAALGYDGLAPRLALGPNPIDGEGSATISQPSISADGSRIAFASTANTLFFGDVNGESDVFVVDRLERTPPPGEQVLPVARPWPAPAPRYALSVRASRRANGTVRVFATTPAAGRIAVRAKTRKAKRRPARLVAQASARRAGAGLAALTLRPKPRYRATTRRKAGLAVDIDVTFTPSARSAKRLTRRVKATFRQSAKRRTTPARTPR